jgi:hypothetical protein
MKFLLILFVAILSGKLNSQTKADSKIYDRIIEQLHSCFCQHNNRFYKTKKPLL